MPSNADHDVDTSALTKRVLDEAWKAVGIAEPSSLTLARGAAGLFMALQVMAAIRDGERDPERLKGVALTAFEEAKRNDASSED
jgi:hypothetical protein